MTWTILSLLASSASYLKDKGSATPRLDAELLLARVLGFSRVALYANFEKLVAGAELDRYREFIRRRARREPVAYILGEREFYGLKLAATPAALIPRPETERLVDEALSLIQSRWPEGPLRLADIGCGGGAIALALASRLSRAEICAVDISPEALALARENALALGLADRASFLEGDLTAPLTGRFHLICANLPYIPDEEMAGLAPDVGEYEPHLALNGGPEGLAVIRRLLKEAPPFLEAGGRLALEIWPASLPALVAAAGAEGLAAAEVFRDLAGRQRIVALSAGPGYGES